MRWHKEMLRGFRDNAAYEAGRYVILLVWPFVLSAIYAVLSYFGTVHWDWRINAGLILVAIIILAFTSRKLIKLARDRTQAQSVPDLSRTSEQRMINMAEGMDLTGLVLSVLNFSYDTKTKRLKAQVIFRNNATPQRTITNVYFIYREEGSTGHQVFDTQTNIGRHSVPINVITVSNGEEHFLKCHADAELSLFEKIGAQAGLLFTFTDRNGRLQSRDVFILSVVQSRAGRSYETKGINGLSLDEQQSGAPLPKNPTHIAIDRMYELTATGKTMLSNLKNNQEPLPTSINITDWANQLADTVSSFGGYGEKGSFLVHYRFLGLPEGVLKADSFPKEHAEMAKSIKAKLCLATGIISRLLTEDTIQHLKS